MIRRLFSNAGVKVVALLLALGYWVLISAPRREKPIDRSYDVPLAFVGTSHDLIITSALRDNVRVRLRGRMSTLRTLSSQNLEATIDLSSLQAPGEVSVPILPSSVNTPQDTEVMAIDPPRVTLRLEARRQKTVPIREFLIGQLPPGYTLGAVTVTPPNALVSGPQSMIRSVGEVATERVILSGRVASFERNVGLVSDNPLIAVVDPPAATVSVEVIPPPSEAPAGEADNSTSRPQ